MKLQPGLYTNEYNNPFDPHSLFAGYEVECLIDKSVQILHLLAVHTSEALNEKSRLGEVHSGHAIIKRYGHFFNLWVNLKVHKFMCLLLNLMHYNTVKPVLKTASIEGPPVYSDHCRQVQEPL